MSAAKGLLRSGQALASVMSYADYNAGRLARIMVCVAPHDDRFLFITDGWTLSQAKAYARQLGFKPLYIVNVWKRNLI